MKASTSIRLAQAHDKLLAEETYRGLFPEKGDKEFRFSVKTNYSGKFGDYNANVKYRSLGYSLEFGLSKKWIEVSDEIKIGLFQSLMQKIFKVRKETTNTDLYNKFLKNLHLSAPKTETEPLLDESFNRMNEKFFNGMLEKTNLVWGNSTHLLGRYEYGSDTIMITKILEEDYELLDYVMYHEMLHKKHKFEAKNGRTRHHTTKFRNDEEAYPNAGLMEERLKRLVTKHKMFRGPKVSSIKKSFKFWNW